MSEPTRPQSYKTLTLSKGKHRSPADGACVMELASMIAHEPFSDHPLSVCPVIAEFLRAYNDAIDDKRRRDLYYYAAKVIGTRSSALVERRRAACCLSFARECQASAGWLTRSLRRIKVGAYPPPELQAVGTYAVKAIPRHTDQSHARALALVDEMCAIGSSPPPGEPAESPAQPDAVLVPPTA